MEFEEAARLVRRLGAIPFFPRDNEARIPIGLWLMETFPELARAEEFVTIATRDLEKFHGIQGFKKIAVQMSRRVPVDEYTITVHPNAQGDCVICNGRGFVTAFDEVSGAITEPPCDCTKENSASAAA